MQQTIEGFRLSPQQARLWVLQQQSNAYRTSCSLVIEGHLHIPRLHQALEAIFRRHEIYRTSFRGLLGVKWPVQVVNPSPLAVWTHYDLRTCSPLDQQRQLAYLLQEVRSPSFDLERGPCVHCTLFTLSEERHLLFVHFSALSADVSTLYSFVEEVAHCYENNLFLSGQDLQDVQYIQFSEWQNTLIEEEEQTSHTYWHDTFQEAFLSRVLPFEQRNFEPTSFGSAWVAVSLETSLSAQIEALLEKQQYQWSVFLLACWQTLLWKLTGHSALLIGLAVDGRISEQLAGIAGPMTTDMPYVSSLSEELSFERLLTNTYETIDELLALYPSFSWEALETAPSTAEASLLYPFSFEWREQPTIVYEGEAVSFSLQQCYACYEPFKVKMIAVHSGSHLTIELHYDANLFDVRDIERLASQFTALVEHAVSHPDACIGELNLLSPAEQQQLLVELNQTQTGFSCDLCLHQLFEQQATSTPDAVAVYDDDLQLTYRGLDGWANRLARHLQRELGVQPEVLVGVSLPHSLELLVGILGILKAGGAYVPLDSASPRKRRASLATDASLSVGLTMQSLVGDLPEIEHLVCLERDWGVLGRYHGETAPLGDVLPTHLAYVLYTSGSTGQPKGVMISHEGLTHYVNWAIERYTLAKGSGAPLYSSLAFDLTVTSLFPPLLAGRSVWLVREERGVEGLAKALRTGADFSLVKLTPAHLDLLNQWLAPGELTGATRQLILGGEALRAELLTTWRLYAPETRLINEYGPTETVVGCCLYEVPSAGQVRSNVPIGRPIANTQIYLLDQHMRPVPWGVIGEIYLGSSGKRSGMARGYLHCADLTAERFVPHPWSQEPGTRLYRTGDLARYVTAAGDLEYVGRVDQQIKVHGIRVELGEIEAVLQEHPAVRECVVLARDGGDQRLVAYVVSMQPEQEPPVRAWREYLRESLPSYMIPTSFVVLKAFPLTVNGKVDRLALPEAPEDQQQEMQGVWEAPQTAIQEILANVWCEVLGRSRVGISENFFELGGHSLLATRLIAQLRAVLQVELSVQAVFEAPTVAGLAERVEQARHAGEGMQAPPLVATLRPEAIPLSFAQQRLWFLDQLEPHSPAYLMAYAYRFQGDLQVKVLEEVMGEVVSRHEALRTTFEEREGDPMQVIHQNSHVVLPVVDLQGVLPEHREQEMRKQALREAERPMCLSTEPLLRTSLFRQDRREQVLLLTLHHIITDGWSNEILVRELTTLYRAKVKGLPSPLPPLLIQYADYAVFQRAFLQGEVLESQLAYWKRQLAGIAPLKLPFDRPRPKSGSHQGAISPFALSPNLSEALLHLSASAQVTLFMTLLAAFQTLLHYSCGQDDIVVGTDVANRQRVEVEGVIGFFVNQLVLRANLSGNPTFREVLSRVREITLQAYTHQDLPFEKLVEVLRPKRTLQHSPLFQVKFLLDKTFEQPLRDRSPADLPEITVSQERPIFIVSREDLLLRMSEGPQGLVGTFTYNTDVFDEATIVRLSQHFVKLLEAVSATPDACLDTFEMMTEEERLQEEVEQEKRLIVALDRFNLVSPKPVHGQHE